MMRRSGGQPFGPGTTDPFGGFGLGGSLFRDFFAEDPFDDPFFRQPFGRPIGPSPMQSMFGGPSLLESMLGRHGSLFGDDFFSGQGGLQQAGVHRSPQQSHGVPQITHGRAPVIQEVEHDDVMQHGDANQNRFSHQQPIVEHPDESDSEDGAGQQEQVPQTTGREQMHNPWAVIGAGNSNRNGAQVFSYQSSSVTYSGIGGRKYHSSSSTRRQGPDGVYEEQHKQEDASGRKEMRVSRGIREKGRTLEQVRDAQGTHRSMETLHNLSQEEAATFDETWQARARESLPLYPGGGRPGTANNQGVGRARPALPEPAPTRRRRTQEPAQNVRHV